MAATIHNNTSSAYDLSMFEERQRKPAQPRTIRVIRNNHPQNGLLFGLSPMAVLFGAMIVVAITSLFIYNNVQLTEIGAQINEVNAQYAELESENVRLQSRLENKMSIKNIENSAENSLGLVKLDRSQIRYISLAPEDVVEVAEERLAAPGPLDAVVAKIKEYLNL